MSWSQDSGQAFLIEPSRSSSDVGRLAARAREIAQGSGIKLKVRRSNLVRILGEGSGRKVEMLEPNDADEIYRSLHVSPTLVMAFAAVFVRRDPSQDPPIRRAAIRLEDFVNYKSTFKLVRGDPQVPAAFQEFGVWKAKICCLGDGDPRVLPFQTFDRSSETLDLSTDSGQAAFKAEYGSASRRVDAGDKLWKRAARRAYHGRVPCHVAGRRLDDGMHWDVSAENKRARILGAAGIWILKTSHAYLNIYPDGYVRQPPKMRAVRRVWPSAR